MTHFCDDPQVALCGADLTLNGWDGFYNHTASAFAYVTCKGCKAQLRLTKFSNPDGTRAWPDPPEWSVKAKP